MIRVSAFFALSLMATVAACSPQKTPEQLQAEQAAATLRQMGAAFGADGQVQLNSQQMAAAIAAASAMNKDMSPEDRAKMQAITGAMASGKVHPAAAAYLAGANKAFAVLSDVKDAAGVEAVKPQLAAIYAEMAAPAAAMKGMNEDERDIAMGSAAAQLMGMSASAMKLMTKFSYDPQTMEAVSKALDQMPQMD